MCAVVRVASLKRLDCSVCGLEELLVRAPHLSQLDVGMNVTLRQLTLELPSLATLDLRNLPLCALTLSMYTALYLSLSRSLHRSTAHNQTQPPPLTLLIIFYCAQKSKKSSL